MIINEGQIDKRQEIIKKTNLILSNYNVGQAKVLFNITNNRIAGMSFAKGDTIEYHPKHAIYNYEYMISIVVPHEAAHWIIYKKYKTSGHCDKWKSIMKELGVVDPQQYHDLAPVWFKHKAPCCGRPISTQVYNIIQKDKYKICECGKFMRFE